jgi:hypothetical protein
MCFVAETQILFVCLEDTSGSLTSNLRGKRSIVRVDYLYVVGTMLMDRNSNTVAEKIGNERKMCRGIDSVNFSVRRKL